MKGLLFDEQPAIATSAPTRMDIACFIGFVRVRPGTTISAPLFRWLDERGWASGPYRRSIEALRDIPVPIETWESFDALFDWNHRTPHGDDHALATDLGAAVRSFFIQGGRKCYVVRVGDPWPLSAPRTERLALLDRLLPGSSFLEPNLTVSMTSTPADRQSWHGVGHLFGLPDVSFVCLPDLPAMVASDPVPLALPAPPSIEEHFVECSDVPLPPPDTPLPRFTAPCCDRTAFADWASIVETIVQQVLVRHLREMELIAAVPLPRPGLTVDAEVITASRQIASPFLQLAFPWCRTATASRLPGGVESPDGILAGILARNALRHGTFRSAANQTVIDVAGLMPELSKETISGRSADVDRPLEEWISLFAQTPSGLQVVSDVTTSPNRYDRPGGVSRLFAVIRRVAREVGEELVFDVSSERLWMRLREAMDTVLFAIWQVGGLRGRTPAQAFHVRCDRSTMSQQDIDQGRLIAYVQFAPALPIDTIAVLLAVDEGGAISIVSPPPE